MTPKPESETDPWARLRRFHCATTYQEMLESPSGSFCLWAEADAVRAAEAAQHQQEIAAKDKQLEQERLVNNRLRLSWREDVDEERAKLNHTRARLAAVEAERDAKSRLIAELEGEAKDLKYHPISGIYAIEAERDRLKAALQDVTIGMDRAGGDRDGMPECPWCQSQGRPEDAEEGYAHDVDCSLMMARAALTPQGQSTDGETR